MQLGKLVFTLLGAVGAYFLAPIVATLFGDMTKASEVANVSEAVVGLSFTIIFLLVYVITCIITAIIDNHISKISNSVNKVKPVKVVGLDRKATKELRKQQREMKKMQMQEVEKSKGSKVIGGILGFVLAFLVMFSVFLPLKYIFNIVGEKSEINYITKGFEYTPYGQLDKAFGINDFIAKR